MRGPFHSGYLLPAVITILIGGCSDTPTPAGECEPWSIPVTLSDEPGAESYTVRGELCAREDLTGRTLQVLSHGAGYGPSYWHFPYRPELYSYQLPALDAGYAIFNFARLGVGQSDRPPATRLSIDVDARVLHQVITFVRDGLAARGTPVGAVVSVSHSMGSVISIAHGVQYPEDVDGIVLTGFVHHVNGDYVRANIANQVLAEDDPRFADRDLGPGYISSSPATRRAFYFEPNADPAVIDLDYETREPVSFNEVIGVRDYYNGIALSLTVPVLEVLGDHDFIGCGTDLAGEVTLTCTDTDAVVANEAERFAPETCLETAVIADAGHLLNLQLNAPTTYGLILDWIDRRIGRDAAQPASAPCR